MFLKFVKIYGGYIMSAFLFPVALISAGTGTTGLANPLGPGVDSLQAFVVKVLEVVIQFGAVIAVFFMIYSGFLFIKASGNEEALSKAKKTFNWTCFGILVLLGAQVIASIITGTICQVAGGNIPGLDCN